MVKSIILIIVIGLAIVFSGCTGSKDVTSAFKAIPEVQQFLSEHPTAKITMTYWSKEEVEKSENEISQQCDKTITPEAMYKATVSEGDLKLVSWINAENQIVLCSTTSGSILTSPKTTSPTSSKIDENRVIDSDARQIIIGDSEIRKIIGTDWTKLEENGNSIFTEPSSSQRTNVGYEKIDTAIRDKETVGIVIAILPNITAAKEAYSGFLLLQREIKTDVNIGDEGKSTNKAYLNNSMILFRKNNVMALIISAVGYEPAIELAEKQEEKISNLLDIISTTQGSGSPQILTPTPIQTSFSTKATTVSVVASNNPDTQAISSNIVIEQVIGDRTTSMDPTLDNILIRLKPHIDTTSIDLRQVIVTVMDTTIRADLNYNSNTASNLSYTAIAVRDEDGSFSLTTPVLNSGDLIEIKVRATSISGITLAPRKTFWLSLNQELGQAVNFEIVTPNSFGVNRYVHLYP